MKKELEDIILIKQEWVEPEDYWAVPAHSSFHKTIDDLFKFLKNRGIKKDEFGELVPLADPLYIRPTKNNYEAFQKAKYDFGAVPDEEFLDYYENDDEVLFHYCCPDDVVFIRQEWMEVEEYTHNPDGYSFHESIDDLKKHIKEVRERDTRSHVPFSIPEFIVPSTEHLENLRKPRSYYKFGKYIANYRPKKDQVLFECSESVYSMLAKDEEIKK
ncbi:MAG: hypothetical protein ABIB43_03290 [archaeon]